MTKNAREVLRYTKIAFDELKETNFSDYEKWILRWITVISLLRAILHVSDKVDFYGKKITEYDNFWKSKKCESIFSEFIDNERNLILKSFGIQSNSIKSFEICAENGDIIQAENGDTLMGSAIFHKKFDKPVYTVISDAIIWIEQYLDEVDDKFQSLIIKS